MFESHGLVGAKHLCKFANVLYCVFTKVVSQGSVDLVGGFYEFEHCVFALYAESAGIGCEVVEFLTWGACVHLFETLVECIYFVFSETSVFGDVGCVLGHVGVGVDVFGHGLSGLYGCVGYLSEW